MSPMDVNTELAALKAQFETGLKNLVLKAALAVQEATKAVDSVVVPLENGAQAVVHFTTNAITVAGHPVAVADLETVIKGLIKLPGLGGHAGIIIPNRDTPSPQVVLPVIPVVPQEEPKV